MSHFDQAAATWDDQPHRVKLMGAVGEAVLRAASPTREMDVLDYGCGTGLVGLYLLPHVRSVAGADNSPGMLDVLGRKIAEGKLANMRAMRLDLQSGPVPADRFGLIVTSMAMHHIADLGPVLRAFYQMLTPGGRVCLADLDAEPGTFHGDPKSAGVHHHGFDRAEIKARLEKIGFVDAADSTVTTFSKPIAGGGMGEFSIFLVTARRP